MGGVEMSDATYVSTVAGNRVTVTRWMQLQPDVHIQFSPEYSKAEALHLAEELIRCARGLPDD